MEILREVDEEDKKKESSQMLQSEGQNNFVSLLNELKNNLSDEKKDEF